MNRAFLIGSAWEVIIPLSDTAYMNERDFADYLYRRVMV